MSEKRILIFKKFKAAFKIIRKFGLNWKSIYQLFNGLLSKSLIIISLATPVSLLFNFTTVMPKQYPTILIGALLILVGYLWAEVATPALIKKFTDGHDYAAELIPIYKSIDWISEFKILEDVINFLPIKVDGYSVKPFDFLSIDEAKSRLGDDVAIRTLSITKYNYVNQKSQIQRMLLTALFFIGVFMIFSSTILHVINILKG
jgi:hypothetical protein